LSALDVAAPGSAWLTASLLRPLRTVLDLVCIGLHSVPANGRFYSGFRGGGTRPWSSAGQSPAGSQAAGLMKGSPAARPAAWGARCSGLAVRARVGIARGSDHVHDQRPRHRDGRFILHGLADASGCLASLRRFTILVIDAFRSYPRSRERPAWPR
jgi:hypothetical protein